MLEDEDILQDFIVEAGEILEQLGVQLVDLEQRGDDRDLLNAIFRGFHTVKGGASFLALTPMVEVCHRAEDVFNALRQGERGVDSALMDAVLQALDSVNGMFEQVRAGAALEPAPAELLRALECLLSGPPAPGAAEARVPAPLPKDAADVEFEAMLAETGTQETPATSDGDEFTDAEFEQLLDAIHGPGEHHGAPAKPAPAAPVAAGNVDEMSEDEFEALLDRLHGPQGAPGADAAMPAPPPSAPAAVEPAAAVKSVESSIRVETKRLDDIMNLVGELVLVRNRLATLKGELGDARVTKAVFDLETVTTSLQDAAMQTRMQPVKKVFGRFPRVVRDLARSLKKEVALELRGEETDLDKNLVEALADPLVHLVRNAVDHGIESPAGRESAGKPRQGRIVLSAEQEGDHILLVIEDDGGGMDPAVLKRRAVEKGLIAPEAAERMSDGEAFDLIFAPGFSTRTEVSDVSGRGVGMDVVKTSIARLNGTIDIRSERGRGSSIRIQVPLTLAILPTLMVGIGGQRFALPLGCIGEIFNLDPSRVRRMEGREVIIVREQAVPIFYLRRWLVRGGDPYAAVTDGDVVLLQIGNQRIAFVVDAVFGQEEVVIKPLGAGLRGLPGFAGATITGDGGIALILDMASLIQARVRKAA